MLKVLESYQKARSLKEAWKIYCENDDCLFLTGGLSVSLREDSSTRCIIDLNQVIPSEIEYTENTLIIGGAAKITDCIEKFRDSVISETFKKVGSHQIRNMASIAGTIAQRYAWSDIITILLALDTKIEIFDSAAKMITLENYLSEKPAGIIVKIFVPLRFTAGEFFKYSHTTYDIAMFNLGVAFSIEGNTIKETRIAGGARPQIAQYLMRTSAMLKDINISEAVERADEFAEAAYKEIKTSSNTDASEEYRKELCSIYLKRSLKALLKG